MMLKATQHFTGPLRKSACFSERRFHPGPTRQGHVSQDVSRVPGDYVAMFRVRGVTMLFEAGASERGYQILPLIGDFHACLCCSLALRAQRQVTARPIKSCRPPPGELDGPRARGPGKHLLHGHPGTSNGLCAAAPAAGRPRSTSGTISNSLRAAAHEAS